MQKRAFWPSQCTSFECRNFQLPYRRMAHRDPRHRAKACEIQPKGGKGSRCGVSLREWRLIVEDAYPLIA
jgi:hypothetical protein